MNKKYAGECTGKQTTFKELKELKQSEAKTATAQITVPALADSDSESELMNNTFNVMYASKTTTDEFGFQENMVAEFKIEIPVNAETIPKYKDLEKTALIPDKYCLICLKDKMDLAKLSVHMSMHHSIAFVGDEDDDPVQEWIDVAEGWKKGGRTSPYSSAESGNEVSNIQSEEEQQPHSDNEQVSPPVTKLSSSKVKHSDSSSDSSSGNVSNGKSKKRLKNARTADKALAGVQNLEIAQRNSDAQLQNIFDNQLEIKSMFKFAQTELRAVKDSIN